MTIALTKRGLSRWGQSIALLCLTFPALAQTQTATPSVQELVKKYLARTEEYSAAFKNLSAEETKYIENYEADGTLKNYRTIISELLVYQPTVAGIIPAEYRSVRSVNGKPLPDAEKRALKMFEDIGKAKSARDEWDRVFKEWSKYDQGQSWWGFTINQGIALKSSLPYFVFGLLGQEEVAGRKTYVVYYRQIAPSPNYTGPTYLVNDIRKFDAYRQYPVLFVGKLWLDVETQRLHREERAMVVYLPTEKLGFTTHEQLRAILTSGQAGDLLTLMPVRWQFTYQASELGILMPKTIEINLYHHFYQPKITTETATGLGLPELRIGHRTRYDYGAFKRFDVTTEETKREIIKP